MICYTIRHYNIIYYIILYYVIIYNMIFYVALLLHAVYSLCALCVSVCVLQAPCSWIVNPAQIINMLGKPSTPSSGRACFCVTTFPRRGLPHKTKDTIPPKFPFHQHIGRIKGSKQNVPRPRIRPSTAAWCPKPDMHMPRFQLMGCTSIIVRA